MPLYHAIVLAVVQGLTEFLPVSSTAHLTLVPWLLNWPELKGVSDLTFDVALHAGTLVAVLLYFWRLWVDMIAAAAGFGDRGDPKVREHRRLFWLFIVGTIPAGIAGLLFEKTLENEPRPVLVMMIGTALIVVAVIMGLADRLQNRHLTLENVGWGEAILVGVAQALAVIPGVSRSGITMTAGLFRGMTRETAARFSFLLSTPLIAGAVLKKGLEVHREGMPPEMKLPFLAGVIVSGIVGYLVIAWLIRFLSHRSFKVFVIYRIALGVIVLAAGWGLLRH